MAASAISRLSSVMRPQGRHWLDYDSIALAVPVIGIGIVMLVAQVPTTEKKHRTDLDPYIGNHSFSKQFGFVCSSLLGEIN
jgi:hypothetical protein